ncbi:hypothetical protein Tco_0424931 [Tanacetum coccineum]
MVPPNNLGPDLSGKAINETQYRGMIGSLMYLTASRPDIQFSTCLYARYQANPKESHLIAVKRIFRYLKGTPSLGLWYPKCLGFDLKGYSDSDYAGCNMDRKSTSAEAEYVAAARCCANILWMKSQLTDYDIIYEKVSFSIPTGGIHKVVGVNNFRNIIGAHYLPYSSKYVTPLSIHIVRPWFEIIGYGEAVPSKGIPPSKERANPQLSSGMSAFNLNKPIYLASFIIHSESASGNDASTVSTAEVDPRNSAPRTDPHVLADQTKYVSDRLDTILTQPLTRKRASSIARQPSFKDLDSPEDDPVIIIEESDKEENDEIHAPKNHNLELKKNKAEAALLKTQPSFPNVEQLKELLDIPSKLNELTGEVASIQAKLKTLDALLGLLSHVTKALNKFDQVLVSPLSKVGDKSVSSAGQADTIHSEGEKNTNQATISHLF